MHELLTYTDSDFSDLSVLMQELSGNPKRLAANALYQKMGFVRNETNCYVRKMVEG